MMQALFRGFAALSLLALVACGQGGPASPAPSPEQLAQAAVAVEGPAQLTLITVINNRSGAGGHTALMISGDQRVIFDPAGSYRPDYVTVAGDVIYGVSDAQFGYYRSAHARSTYHVVTQSIPVAPHIAAQALARAKARGTVPGAFCARATSEILAALPGFESLKPTFYPTQLMDQIAALPGVETDRYYENDDGHVLDGIPDLRPSE